MILAGDIGGTKTYLALFDENNNRLEKIRETRFENRNFPDLDSIIEEFLKSDNEKPLIVCLGVAGPIIDGNCDLTNLDWRIETGRLKKQFDKAYLINDLVAMACAVPCLDNWSESIALDDLMTQSALQSFTKDQNALDDRIRSFLK